MFLTSPDLAHAAAFRRFVGDLRRYGEAGRFARYEAAERDFPGYVDQLLRAARGEGLPPGQEPYYTFWLIDGTDVVGVARVRAVLSAKAEKNDGHIGYDIAPAHRRKGYGTALLRLALAEARRMGLTRVVLTCAAANIASRRVIEKCGGSPIGSAIDDDSGEPLSRYELVLTRDRR